jgi:hypothetical protein
LNTTTNGNTITIQQAGDYLINYDLSTAVSVATTLTTGVQVNGTQVPSLTTSQLASVGTNTLYSGSQVLHLNAGDVLSLDASSPLITILTTPSGGAQLSAVRIG